MQPSLVGMRPLRFLLKNARDRSRAGLTPEELLPLTLAPALAARKRSDPSLLSAPVAAPRACIQIVC